MYWAQDTTSQWAWVYFILIVFFGSFFLVNLLLAVLAVTYDAVSQREEISEIERRMADMVRSSRKAPVDSANQDDSSKLDVYDNKEMEMSCETPFHEEF